MSSMGSASGVGVTAQRARCGTGRPFASRRRAYAALQTSPHPGLHSLLVHMSGHQPASGVTAEMVMETAPDGVSTTTQSGQMRPAQLWLPTAERLGMDAQLGSWATCPELEVQTPQSQGPGGDWSPT